MVRMQVPRLATQYELFLLCVYLIGSYHAANEGSFLLSGRQRAQTPGK